jgi:hypothetical protein
MSKALRSGAITEQSCSEALLTAKGDLFIASSYLGVKPRELDSYIRASEDLQAFVAAIGYVKSTTEYSKLSAEQFADQMEIQTRSYRLEALDVIHEIATMEDNGPEPLSAAMMEVKLKAAIQLRGSAPEAPVGNQQSQILTELNQLYQQASTRIKSIRVAQIEYD